MAAEVKAALVGGDEKRRAWIRCCRSCWADRSSTNCRAMAVARAWVVVGEEFMRFIDDASMMMKRCRLL